MCRIDGVVWIAVFISGRAECGALGLNSLEIEGDAGGVSAGALLGGLCFSLFLLLASLKHFSFQLPRLKQKKNRIL